MRTREVRDQKEVSRMSRNFILCATITLVILSVAKNPGFLSYRHRPVSKAICNLGKAGLRLLPE